MNKVILYVISISCIFLSSFAMEIPSTKKQRTSTKNQSSIKQIPNDVLALILFKAITQSTIEEALNQIKVLKLVSKQFNKATHIFTIEKLAQRFNLTPRAVALRIIKILEAKKCINFEQKQAILKNYPLNQTLDKEFIAAAKEGNIEKIKDLIQKNANVNAQDDNGTTALMIAIIKGNRDMVELLIKADADITIQDKQNNIAFLFAGFLGNKDIIELLITAVSKE